MCVHIVCIATSINPIVVNLMTMQIEVKLKQKPRQKCWKNTTYTYHYALCLYIDVCVCVSGCAQPTQAIWSKYHTFEWKYYNKQLSNSHFAALTDLYCTTYTSTCCTYACTFGDRMNERTKERGREHAVSVVVKFLSCFVVIIIFYTNVNENAWFYLEF